MRTYKFRAWDRRTRMMVYDFALCSGGQVQRVYRGKEYNSALRHLDSSGCWGVLDFSDWYANCDDFVVMQFTGLLDADGKEIYENDVLSAHSDGYVVVKWFQAGWICEFGDENSIGMDEMCIWFGNDSHVLGNTFEHPNLINKTYERIPDPPPEQERGDVF